MIGGNGVEDEVETAGVLLHLGGVFGDDDFVGAETLAVFDFAGEVVNRTTFAPKAFANFRPI